jgi:hypothetical protein
MKEILPEVRIIPGQASFNLSYLFSDIVYFVSRPDQGIGVCFLKNCRVRIGQTSPDAVV